MHHGYIFANAKETLFFMRLQGQNMQNSTGVQPSFWFLQRLMCHTCFCCSWHLLDAQRTESPSLTMCKSWHPVLLKTEQRTKKHISKLKCSAPSCDVKSQPAVTNDPTLSDWWPLPNWLTIPLSHSWSHSHWLMISLSLTHDPTLTDSWSHSHYDPTRTDSWSHSHWLMIPLSLLDDPSFRLRIPP